MSPEQVRGQATDRRTDIWAFGCVLYEMLAGRSPFGGPTISDTFVGILEREPNWEALPADTPPSVRRLLDRCLRKHLRKRLHDIADALIDIEERNPSPVAPAPTDIVPPPVLATHRTRERFAWIAAGVFAVVACTMAVLYLAAPPPPVGSLEFPIGPPEHWVFESSYLRNFEVSPDGRHVVAAAYSQAVTMLWVRPIANPAWRQLPGTQGARGPFWSPDSQSLGFFVGGKLKTVSVSGGPPVTVADAAETGLGQVFSGAWNREGVILFGASANSLRRVSSSGGNPAPATALGQGEVAHRWPSFLPDGRHFLYLAVGPEASELRMGSLDSGDVTSLGPADSSALYASGYLLFVRSGRLMAQRFDTTARRLTGEPLVVSEQIANVGPWQPGQFSVSATSVLGYTRSRPLAQLTWMARTGIPLRTAGDPGSYANLDLSPDGRRVAVSHLKNTPGATPVAFDIWLIDVEGADPPSRLTSDPAFEYDPAWSADGTKIAFNSSRLSERLSLWVRPSDGTGKDQLLRKSEGSIYAPHWSPDGHSLIYTEQGTSTGSDLWTLRLTGNRTPEVFLRTAFNEGSGVFSPDSAWVAYESDASGRREVWVCAFPAATEQIQISHDGGRAPRWRGDGRELFFLGLDGTLMAASITTGSRIQATVAQPLFQTRITGNNYHPYAADKSGQRFLIPVFREAPGSIPITVVLNWPATLPK